MVVQFSRSLSQIGLTDNVVPLENPAGLVSADLHRDALGEACLIHCSGEDPRGSLSACLEPGMAWLDPHWGVMGLSSLSLGQGFPLQSSPCSGAGLQGSPLSRMLAAPVSLFENASTHNLSRGIDSAEIVTPQLRTEGVLGIN